MYNAPNYKRSASPDGLQLSVFKAIRNARVINSDDSALPSLQCPLAKMEENAMEPEIMDLRIFASNRNEQQQKLQPKVEEKKSKPPPAHPVPEESLDDVALTVRWARACSTGNLRTIGELLKKKPYLISYAPAINHGLSGLHYAAKDGHSGVVRYLISNGADINLRTSGYTPLHLAAIGKQHDIVSILLRDYGADSSIEDYSGHTYDYYLVRAQGNAYTSVNDENAVRGIRYEPQGGAPVDAMQFSRLKSFRKAVHGRMRFFGTQF